MTSLSISHYRLAIFCNKRYFYPYKIRVETLIAHTFSAANKECCIYTSNAKKYIDFCHICKCPLTYMIKIAGK